MDFSRYAVSYFNPFLFSGTIRQSLGCGASALSLLTGVPPEYVAAKSRDGHYSDEFMVRFLRQRGCHVWRLTQCNVSTAISPLGDAHVILISQLLLRNEGTWGVIYDNKYYHNYSILNVNFISLLNKPILSAYLVVHPKWQLSSLVMDKPSGPQKITNKSMSWSKLTGQ